MKVLCIYLKDELSDELESIDTRLRVSPNINMVLRTDERVQDMVNHF